MEPWKILSVYDLVSACLLAAVIWFMVDIFNVSGDLIVNRKKMRPLSSALNQIMADLKIIKNNPKQQNTTEEDIKKLKRDMYGATNVLD